MASYSNTSTKGNIRMSETLQWSPFTIGEIFTVSTGAIIPSHELTPGEIPRISAKSDSNGVLGKYATEQVVGARHVNNCITVNFFGADGGIFYHPEIVSLEMKVHALKLKGQEFTLETGLFLSACLKKSLSGFGYGNQLSSSKLANNDYKVFLPVKSTGEIDYEYMTDHIRKIQADHIRKIQADHIRKIQAYLEITGFNLEEIISGENLLLSPPPPRDLKKFNISELFHVKRGTRLVSSQRIPGNIPLVTAGYENTGVSAHISNTTQYVFCENTLTIDMFANVFYRDYPYCADDNIISLSPKNPYSKKSLLYIVTCIEQSLKGKYSYGKQFRLGELDNNSFYLPVGRNNFIDFLYMEKYIENIQKDSIKKIIQWQAKEIEALKLIS